MCLANLLDFLAITLPTIGQTRSTSVFGIVLGWFVVSLVERNAEMFNQKFLLLHLTWESITFVASLLVSAN